MVFYDLIFLGYSFKNKIVKLDIYYNSNKVYLIKWQEKQQEKENQVLQKILNF